MKKRIAAVTGLVALVVAVWLVWNNFAPAQLGERPGNSLDNPIDTPRDLTGLSIKNPRVRVVHTTDPNKAGRLDVPAAGRSLARLQVGPEPDAARSSANATASTATPASSTACCCPTAPPR